MTNPIPDLAEPAEALLEYWQQCRGESPLPHRSCISPVRLRRWLGDISVVHVHDGAKRFFVALQGENVNRLIGPGLHQRYLEDAVSQASLPLAIAPYAESLRLKLPVYSTIPPTVDNRLVYRLTRLVLPFHDHDPFEVARFIVWVAPNERAPDDDRFVYPDSCDACAIAGSLQLYPISVPRGPSTPACAKEAPA